MGNDDRRPHLTEAQLARRVAQALDFFADPSVSAGDALDALGALLAKPAFEERFRTALKSLPAAKEALGIVADPDRPLMESFRQVQGISEDAGLRAFIAGSLRSAGAETVWIYVDRADLDYNKPPGNITVKIGEPVRTFHTGAHSIRFKRAGKFHRRYIRPEFLKYFHKDHGNKTLTIQNIPAKWWSIPVPKRDDPGSKSMWTNASRQRPDINEEMGLNFDWPSPPYISRGLPFYQEIYIWPNDLSDGTEIAGSQLYDKDT